MPADTHSTDALRIHTLSDALGVGLGLLDLFGDDDCCAVWLGGDADPLRDFIVCDEDRGRDVERVVRYAVLSATLRPDVTEAVLWRTVPDVTDGPTLAEAFFDHQRELASVGVTLVDEVVLCDDELRSLAVTTFTDRPGWDDVSHRIHDLDGLDSEEDPWPPWAV